METLTSIDMVRIKFKMHSDRFVAMMQRYTDSYFIRRENEDKYVQSTGYFDYANLWTFEADESSITIGYGLNSVKNENNQGFIEWNPNKVEISKHGYLSMLVRDILICTSFNLSRCDIANDIMDIDLNNCFFDRMRKRGFHTYTGDTSTTCYFGSRGKAGQVKIYDKTKEVKDNTGVTIGKRIRYETTYGADIYFVPDGRTRMITGGLEAVAYPQLVIVQNELLEALTVIDKAVITHLMKQPESIEQMTRRQKDKYKGANVCSIYTPSYDKDSACAFEWYKQFVKWIHPNYCINIAPNSTKYGYLLN